MVIMTKYKEIKEPKLNLVYGNLNEMFGNDKKILKWRFI